MIGDYSEDLDLTTQETSSARSSRARGQPLTPEDAGVRIRPLAWADVPRVAALETELFGASAWTMGMLTEELRGAGRRYIGAQPLDGGGHTPLVGYGGLWFDRYDAHIMTIGVASAHQGSGLGQVILQSLVEQARALGARSMLLEVAVNNPAAISMYERSGFTRIGLRKRYYQPEDVDAFTMQLKFPGAGNSTPGA